MGNREKDRVGHLLGRLHVDGASVCDPALEMASTLSFPNSKSDNQSDR